MQEILIISNIFSFLMTIIGLLFLAWGIITLIFGKCRLPGNLLKGKAARIVGLVFIVTIICATAIYAILYESFKWGYSGKSAMVSITVPLVQGFLLLFGIIGAYFWANSKAKKNKQIVK